jgi:hypothetical protein
VLIDWLAAIGPANRRAMQRLYVEWQGDVAMGFISGVTGEYPDDEYETRLDNRPWPMLGYDFIFAWSHAKITAAVSRQIGRMSIGGGYDGISE